MMGHWIIVPVVMPAVVAALIVLVMRHDLVLQRVVSTAAVAALVGVAVALFANAGTVQAYRLGDWPAPFGIVLMLDRLSALMVLLTAVLAAVVILYAIGSGWDGRGRHFHALFQFQLMGICGAFLTGDAFNLFVFFEVLLIASYGLMIHAGGGLRLRMGVQYVIFNLAGSTLFLFALGTLYGVTGTLNMADLAVKMGTLAPADQALARVGAMLLLLVFAVKGALVPLQFWLPGTYANAPAPVAALFAIMTKVGAYAVIRMYVLVFPPDSAVTGTLFADLLLPAALVTLALGALGVLGADRMGKLAAFAAIASMGTVFTAVAGFTEASIAAALYYIIHSTFAGAALFLVVDLVRARRGPLAGRLVAGPAFAGRGLVAALFFAAAIAAAGMPPLSGFLGKLLILDALRTAPGVAWIWGVILVTSLVTLVGLARAGSLVFWSTAEAPALPELPPAEAPPPAPALALVAAAAPLVALVALTVLAGPVSRETGAIAADLFARTAYIDAALETDGAKGMDADDTGEAH